MYLATVSRTNYKIFRVSHQTKVYKLYITIIITPVKDYVKRDMLVIRITRIGRRLLTGQ